MRINKFVALASGLSRRGADAAIAAGRVTLNNQSVTPGLDVLPEDSVLLDGQIITPPAQLVTILLNKPTGYVVSRQGQGSSTIYELLPPALQMLNPVGRLDKDSSGLLLLTNDGKLANDLTHPSRQKRKLYQITIDKPLQPLHRQFINDTGVTLDDGLSQLSLERQNDGDDYHWIVAMHEGRNRQIRRTFDSLGYQVTELHRTHFGQYQLTDLLPGQHTTA